MKKFAVKIIGSPIINGFSKECITSLLSKVVPLPDDSKVEAHPAVSGRDLGNVFVLFCSDIVNSLIESGDNKAAELWRGFSGDDLVILPRECCSRMAI